jgi:hypothetical protein
MFPYLPFKDFLSSDSCDIIYIAAAAIEIGLLLPIYKRKKEECVALDQRKLLPVVSQDEEYLAQTKILVVHSRYLFLRDE